MVVFSLKELEASRGAIRDPKPEGVEAVLQGHNPYKAGPVKRGGRRALELSRRYPIFAMAAAAVIGAVFGALTTSSRASKYQ